MMVMVVVNILPQLDLIVLIISDGVGKFLDGQQVLMLIRQYFLISLITT
jgi:hypothetical protein